MILNAGTLDTLLGHDIAGCKEDLRITENTLAVLKCALRQVVVLQIWFMTGYMLCCMLVCRN